MIAIGSTNLVTLAGHQDLVSGDYINDASVTASVLDCDGEAIISIPLDYISDSDGNYQGVIIPGDSEDLEDGLTYTVTVEAVSSYGTLLLRNVVLAAYES